MNSETIHGHEVLKLMVKAGGAWSREKLLRDIRSTFGTDARFHTCTEQSLNAEELLDFLQSRGKIENSSSGYRADEQKICSNAG